MELLKAQLKLDNAFGSRITPAAICSTLLRWTSALDTGSEVPIFLSKNSKEYVYIYTGKVTIKLIPFTYFSVSFVRPLNMSRSVIHVNSRSLKAFPDCRSALIKS